MSVWSDQAAGFLEICESSSSEVWKHFLKNRHTEKARCKTCKTTLSCKDGTITTLKNQSHGISISTKRLHSEAEENDETEVFPSTQNNLRKQVCIKITKKH